MGYGLITITKELDGEAWSNTYGCVINADFSQPLTVSDLDAINANEELTDTNTLPGDAEYLGSTHPLAALVGLERLLHFQGVLFTSLFISDGQKNQGSGVFQSVPLSFLGQRSLEGAPTEAIMPGNVTWMIIRQPVATSVRTGRLFYRAALYDGAVRFGGRGGIDWASLSEESANRAYLAQAVTDSEIPLYLAGGANEATFVLGIPQYYPFDNANAGDVSNVNAQGAFVAGRPTSRQVKRGRRRSGGG